MRLVTVATCNLRQWALDFEGNRDRVIESIRVAKEKGATLRTGPELELCGYGCLDHLLEVEVFNACWAMLSDILLDRSLDGIICDVGMPIMHDGTRFNARIIILNGKVLLIRPKLYLAEEGNYREMRYFTGWRPNYVETYKLRELSPDCMALQDGRTVPIGDAIISARDATFGAETCEELFTPMSPHNALSLAGCEIVCNSSGSHHELRKLNTRISLIQEATRKTGGVYLYANQIGCDGDRLYYDGCAMVIVNGDIVAQGSQFSLNQVEVITATVDLEAVWAYRTSPSHGQQSMTAPRFQKIEADIDLVLSDNEYNPSAVPSAPIELRVHSPEEEISLGPACWLADYLFRSKAAGFFIPLSGGLDSASTATIVFSSCTLMMKALEEGNEYVRTNVARLYGAYHEGEMPKTAQELCNTILHTAFLGMATQSSPDTRSRAERLAKAIGSFHVSQDIDAVYDSIKDMLTQATGFQPRFRVHGGSQTSNLALQNIQARARMVISYYFAQELCETRNRKAGGSLLVLGSGNVDECLRGYLTKYDCSSADLNPIGSISKTDLRAFLRYAQGALGLSVLKSFLDATPTAELEPITAEYVQSDEADMGLTYTQLSVFGRLRKEQKLGPLGAFSRLAHLWRNEMSVRDIAQKTKHFYHCYAINRHKMTTMTPAYHAESYSPDDNRYDMRPFLYPPFYESWSFKQIDKAVEKMEKAEKAATEKKDAETKN